MDWFDRVRSETDALLRATELPRNLLRHLLVENGLDIGSRVLVVGGNVGTLVRYLQWLGLTPLGLIESAQEVMACRREMPRIDFHFGRFDESIAIPQHSLDGVIVRSCTPWQASLFAPSALRATANLAACVRPSGMMSVVTTTATSIKSKSEGEAGLPHGANCFESQWREFPGEVSSLKFPRGHWLSQFVHRRLGQGAKDDVVLTSLRISEQAISRGEWLKWAEGATPAQAKACCHPTAVPLPSSLRRAA